MTEPRVAIIGGGITGLAAAWDLKKHGIPYTLFEASERIGGKIVTEHIDGFTVEGGPDSFLTSKPWAWQLCDELGLRDRIIGTNDAQRNVYILKGGKLHPYPKGMRLIVPVEEEGLLASELISDEGKRRMLTEVDLQPYDAPADESLASFVRRHFGQEALDVFAEPLLAGIYVGDPEQMSIRATYPQYVEMERTHGSLIRAMRSAPPASLDPRAPKTAFFSLKGGTQELVDALASKLTGDIRLKINTRFDLFETSLPPYQAIEFVSSPKVERFSTILMRLGRLLEPFQDTHTQFTSLYKRRLFIYQALLRNRGNFPVVIATISAHEMFVMLSFARIGYQQSVLHHIFGYLYSKETGSTVVNLGYRKEDVPFDLNGFGFVVPRNEPTEMKACTWSSTKLSERAPDDCVLIRVFLKGPYYDLHVANALARIELEKFMGIPRALVPKVRRSYRWLNQQYTIGHSEQIARIEQLLPLGVFLAGSSYRGVGVPDCIHQGQIAAQKAIAHLSGKTPNEVT